ncbi:MAG TPA: PIG-L family deacetylase [Ktedonobacteraceae bacterium]|nr:PIG-L family deacetylase [Ktedonobacteraceae bacterium]
MATAQSPMRILGVFVHPDDESFCAGGTFASFVADDAEVMVVSATRSEEGQIRSAGIQHKIEAIAAHHTQFPIEPDMLPLSIFQELMGREYFVPVPLVYDVDPALFALHAA